MAATQEIKEYESRTYQRELYEAAKERNIIACLGTGTGKTFIAILLMSDSQYLPQLNGSYLSGVAKRTFFLVPTRPLVQQQRDAIMGASQTSDLKVGGFSGDMNVDFWVKTKWEAELEKYQVIVMTPQILLDMLNHRHISFDKINLLVVDEVHWAARRRDKKESGHPYKQIMNLYNKFDPTRRPRVLGLSATPINCSMKVEAFSEAVQDIEKTYSAVCMTGDVGNYGTNPKEVVWGYTTSDAPLSASAGAVVKSLDLFVSALRASIKPFKDQRKCPTFLTRMKKILSTVRNILADPDENNRTITDQQSGEKYPLIMTWMGIWCASVAVNFYIKEIDEFKKVYEDVDPSHHRLWDNGVKYLQQIQNVLALEIKCDPMSALNTASPKMHRLLELLRNYQTFGGQESTLCGIIFVNQRCVAKVLCDWLIELKTLLPNIYGFLNVGWVVGHAARPGLEAKIAFNSDRRQREVIEQFHNKHLNLLVATSVLEEGLDVRKCNLVVRYDRLNTFREYLQSKGRARAEDAYYYIMTPDEDRYKLWKKLNDFRQMEELVKNINNKVSLVTSTTLEDDEEDSDLFYRSETTDAIITGRSAIALLYKYCQKLATDSFTRLEPVFSVKQFMNLFKGTVKLPVNCPLKGLIVGPFKKDKELAKKAVALLACKQLHEIGELNDHLLPDNKEAAIRDYVLKLGLRIETLDNDQEARECPTKAKVGTRSRKDTIVKQIANVFTKNGTNLRFLNRISITFPKTDSLPNNCRTFGVITDKPIVITSLFPIYLKNRWHGMVDGIESSEVRVEFIAIDRLNLNVEQMESIEKFHCYTIEEVMRFSVKEFVFEPKNSDFNLLIVPLLKGSAIDWNIISKTNTIGTIDVKEVSAEDRLNYRFDEQSFNDCVFYPWYRKDRSVDQNGRPFVYYSLKVSDLNSRSQWQETDYKTFDEYFLKKYKIDIKNKNLPLIHGKAINKGSKGVFKGAQLKPYSTNRKDNRYPEYFPPELVCIHPFPASLWRQALCLPAVLYRLNHLYLAEELRQTIHSETIPKIGSLRLEDNCLKMELRSGLDSQQRLPESESDSESSPKRLFDSVDSDDECEGHEYNDEMEVDFHRKTYTKRMRKENQITIQKTTTPSTVPTISSTSLYSVPIVSSGTDVLTTLLRYTDAMISNFRKLVLNHINGKDQFREQLALAVIMSEINSPQATTLPDLKYGEAFPFIFKGNIEPHIREKYDAKVGDPIKGPSADLILQALTMVGANDAFNLERLEVIGDSFLKLVSSAFVYFSCEGLDEGRLSYLRQIQICNCNLYFIGCEKNVGELLVSHKWFPNNNWLLPSYDISDEKDLQILEKKMKAKDENNNRRTDSFKYRKVKNKSIADSVEALIGAHLMIGGNKSALIFMEWLGLKVRPLKDGVPYPIDYLNERNLGSGQLFRWLPSPKDPICRLDSTPQEVRDFIHDYYSGANLHHFEQIIGYEFRNKAYLIQALTHSSFHFNEFTDCYQKLEFLGDAIIDYLISRHIFATPGKSFSPGQLTDLRSALVNNAFFAAIAVKYKFHKFLKNLSPDLFHAIQNFEQNFSASEMDSVIKSFNKLTEEDCNDVEEIEVPKALGDIFESVAGAIFLDNGLSLDGVWKVYYRLLKPEIDYFTENIPKMAVQEIWETCPAGEVEFGKSEKMGRKVRVVLTAKGKKYGGVGKNRKFAKIAASKNALKDLKDQI